MRIFNLRGRDPDEAPASAGTGVEVPFVNAFNAMILMREYRYKKGAARSGVGEGKYMNGDELGVRLRIHWMLLGVPCWRVGCCGFCSPRVSASRQPLVRHRRPTTALCFLSPMDCGGGIGEESFDRETRRKWDVIFGW